MTQPKIFNYVDVKIDVKMDAKIFKRFSVFDVCVIREK